MKKTLSIFVFTCMVSLSLISHAQVSEQRGIASLWKGIGGKLKWNNTDFILFSANGNDAKYLLNGRKFLIDKKTHKCRFEGKTVDGQNLVVLFDFKAGKILRYYNNRKEVAKNSPEAQASFQKINEQFLKDAALLFLPAFIDQPETKISKVGVKIHNAEKLQSFSFQLKDNNLTGDLLFNAESGYIKQLVDKEGNEYVVNGYKDIGGGLILPTSFHHTHHADRNTSFTTVAAFTDIETDKFESL